MDGVRSGYSAKTADLSTALRSVDKHSQRRTAGPQISPLRSFGAPVEMTKGRAVLPLSVVAEQNPFPGKDRWTADLSTTLLRSSGRDDKGEGGASIECGC